MSKIPKTDISPSISTSTSIKQLNKESHISLSNVVFTEVMQKGTSIVPSLQVPLSIVSPAVCLPAKVAIPAANPKKEIPVSLFIPVKEVTQKDISSHSQVQNVESKVTGPTKEQTVKGVQKGICIEIKGFDSVKEQKVNKEDMIWTEKYKPQSLKDIVGNTSAISKVRN